MSKLSAIIKKNLESLSECGSQIYQHTSHDGRFYLPNLAMLREVIEKVKQIVFPGFFNVSGFDPSTQKYHHAIQMEHLYTILAEQISNGLLFFSDDSIEDKREAASERALAFIEQLPQLKEMLCSDVASMYARDPAAKSHGEVIISYPSIQAMIHYRTAHELLKLDIPLIPRIITEMAHTITGIDIHPGAKIGHYFSIDHGTGVVIGETCVIGEHVCLYQGVTLGAKSFNLDQGGRPINEVRHPIIEDNVVIYANSTILGRITIGHDSVIGGNIWLTHSVPPNSRILQQKALADK